VTSIERWWRDGAQLEVALNGSERHCFVRRFRNTAPHMTLLHGFPSSSHDWAKVAPALAPFSAVREGMVWLCGPGRVDLE
jgi:pimeloyl-ACP methyl ester carboxylesterase